MACEAGAQRQMSEPFLDTDVLMRFITGDDPVKQANATAMIRQIETGELTVRLPDTVIADAVYVLSSSRTYRMPRAEIREELVFLLRLPHFKVHNRRLLLRPLDIYVKYRVDFGDAMIVAAAERRRTADVISYDHDFDRIVGIVRQEP